MTQCVTADAYQHGFREAGQGQGQIVHPGIGEAGAAAEGEAQEEQDLAGVVPQCRNSHGVCWSPFMDQIPRLAALARASASRYKGSVQYLG